MCYFCCKKKKHPHTPRGQGNGVILSERNQKFVFFSPPQMTEVTLLHGWSLALEYLAVQSHSDSSSPEHVTSSSIARVLSIVNEVSITWKQTAIKFRKHRLFILFIMRGVIPIKFTIFIMHYVYYYYILL